MSIWTKFGGSLDERRRRWRKRRRKRNPWTGVGSGVGVINRNQRRRRRRSANVDRDDDVVMSDDDNDVEGGGGGNFMSGISRDFTSGMNTSLEVDEFSFAGGNRRLGRRNDNNNNNNDDDSVYKGDRDETNPFLEYLNNNNGNGFEVDQGDGDDEEEVKKRPSYISDDEEDLECEDCEICGTNMFSGRAIAFADHVHNECSRIIRHGVKFGKVKLAAKKASKFVNNWVVKNYNDFVNLNPNYRHNRKRMRPLSPDTIRLHYTKCNKTSLDTIEEQIKLFDKIISGLIKYELCYETNNGPPDQSGNRTWTKRYRPDIGKTIAALIKERANLRMRIDKFYYQGGGGGGGGRGRRGGGGRGRRIISKSRILRCNTLD